MNDTLVSIVKAYSQEIENGRTPVDILAHLKSEVLELQQEVEKKMEGFDPGDDGIPGESIDIILCALDLIYVTEPDITEQQLLELADRKCRKWKSKYFDEDVKG